MNSLTKGSSAIIFITSLIVCSDIYAIAGRVVYSYGDVQATSNTEKQGNCSGAEQ